MPDVARKRAVRAADVYRCARRQTRARLLMSARDVDARTSDARFAAFVYMRVFVRSRQKITRIVPFNFVESRRYGVVTIRHYV